MNIASAVKQDIERTEIGRTLLNVLCLTDVQASRLNLGVLPIEGGEQGLVDVGRPYVGALAGKRDGRGPSYTLSGGRDQGYLSIKSSAHFPCLIGRFSPQRFSRIVPAKTIVDFRRRCGRLV